MAENFDENPPRHITFSSFPEYYMSDAERSLLLAERSSDETTPERAEEITKQIKNSDDAKLNGEYSLDAVKQKFEEENDITLEKFLIANGAKSGDMEDKMELYRKLYAIQDMANDDTVSPSKTTIGFGKNEELCLAVKLPKTEDYDAFGIIIRDGKVTFSSSNLSVDQIREAYHFLYMRGVSGIEIPDNLEKALKDNLNQVISEGVDQTGFPYENTPEAYNQQDVLANAEGSNDDADNDGFPDLRDEELTDNEFSQWAYSAEMNNSPDGSEKAQGCNYGVITSEMDKWGPKMGEIPGLTYFKTRRGGWDVWTTFQDPNPDNLSHQVKEDKDGNLKPRWKNKIATRMRNGHLEIAFSTPPGAKMSDQFAEQMGSLADKSGAKYIHFTGVKDEDMFTVRIASAKEGVVPQGIKLKVDGMIKMMDKNRENRKGIVGFEYERLLVDQMYHNSIRDKGKLSPTDMNFWEDSHLRCNIANFRPIYKERFENKLKGLKDTGAPAVDIIGASNATVWIYVAYRKSIRYNDNMLKDMLRELVPPLAKLPDMPTEIDKDKHEKMKKSIESVHGEIKKFKEQYPEIDLDTAKTSDLTGDQLEFLYDISLKRHKKEAQDELDRSFLERRGPSDSALRIASEQVNGVQAKLATEMKEDFGGYINFDGSSKVHDYGLSIPEYRNMVNITYRPTPEIEQKRTDLINKTIRDRKEAEGGSKDPGDKPIPAKKEYSRR